MPGFRNCKYDPAHLVTVEYPSDSTYRPVDFRLEDSVFDSALPLRLDAGTYSPVSKNTHSEQDWAWVVQQLSLGEDAGKLTLMTSLPDARINPILSTTPSALSTSLPLVFR